MDAHAGVTELLGAWALDACEGGEAATVEAHLDDCAGCAAEAQRLRAAAGWVGVERVAAPPARLRGSMLAEARARRPPSVLRTLTDAYAIQVTRLDRVLAALAPDDWRRADPRHNDLRGLVAHLAANDAMLAADVGLPVVEAATIHSAWRAQADTLVRGLTDEAVLDRPVRLAGKGEPVVRPVRDALVQRAFETWTHLDDAGAVLGRPQLAPPPEQVRRIVDLAVGLLPFALRANGLSRPGRAARLVLSGRAGGEWVFPLGDDSGPVDVTIAAEAVEFARLVANRRSPDTLRQAVTGDRVLGADLLRIAATLGCD